MMNAHVNKFRSVGWRLALGLALCALALATLFITRARAADPWPVRVGSAQAGLLMIASPSNQPATNVGGVIVTDTTWALTGSPYVVTGNVTVADGVTLTIEAGVQIIVNQGRQLEVQGRLHAVGTPTAPIQFVAATAGVRGYWRHLRLGGGNVLTDSNASRLSYVVFDGGGAGGLGALFIDRSAPTLDHLTIRRSSSDGLHGGWPGAFTLDTALIEDNSDHGIYFDGGSGGQIMSNLTIRNNGGDGLRVNGSVGGVFHPNTGHQVLSQLAIQNNGGYGFFTNVGGDSLVITAATFISNGVSARLPVNVQLTDVHWSGDARREIEWERGTLLADRAWPAHPNIAAYRLVGTPVVADGVTLTVAPGVQVIVNQGVGLEVQGRLHAVGAPTAPIQFVAAAAGVRGYWRHLRLGGGNVLTDSDASRLSYLVFDGGGMGGLGTLFIDRSAPTLDHLTIRRSSGDGLHAIWPGPFTLDTALIEDNAGKGLALYSGLGGQALSNLVVRNNGSDGIYFTCAYGGWCNPDSGNQILTKVALHGNDGDGIFANRALLLDTATITGSTGAAIHYTTANLMLTHRDLTLSGNGRDGVVVDGGSITGRREWALTPPDIPIFINGDVIVEVNSLLALGAGAELRFATNRLLKVHGRMFALGRPAAPIRLTAQSETPGAWRGVEISEWGSALWQHCDLAFGGGSSAALVTLRTSQAALQDCRIHHSAGDGLRITHSARPVLSQMQIFSNTAGVNNTTPATIVDARQAWWGDASGPRHPTANPAGLGNAVSDGVLFAPWRASPFTGTAPAGQLQVQVSGPANVSPGQAADYAIAYSNSTTQTVENAVLVLALPHTAEYLESTHEGIYWQNRHQVFWRLGHMPPGKSDILAARVRYQWGLPNGLQESAVALIGGANWPGNAFEVNTYLAYTPTTVIQATNLITTAVQIERQMYPGVAAIIERAEANGYGVINAHRLELSSGKAITEIILLEPNQEATMRVRRDENNVSATVLGRTYYAIQDPSGGMTISLQFQSRQMWGDWANNSSAYTAQPLADVDFTTCFGNCIAKNLPEWILSNLTKVGKIVFRSIDCIKCVNSARKGWMETNAEACVKCAELLPGYGEAQDGVNCKEECEKDPSSHVCTANKRVCSQTTSVAEIWELECDLETGRLHDKGGYVKTCVPVGIGKCVQDGPGGEPRCVCQGGLCDPNSASMCANSVDNVASYLRANWFTWQLSDRNSDSTPAPVDVQQACPDDENGSCRTKPTRIRVARDPNAKYGPAGDLLPGQQVTYTITYENEGAGRAYGVFVVDPLSDVFDDRTLVAYGAADYLAAGRTLIWRVGELAPQGQPGSTGAVTFTARLRSDLPGGTAVINQAIVHFPSVPEETPTNPVVNLIQPVAGLPQNLEVAAGQALPITLQGRDVISSALRYAIASAPQHGVLRGVAPTVVYTPAANFSGLDRFTFTVTNGVAASRPAEVQILVQPSPSDAISPEVLWAEPVSGTVIAEIAATPYLTDTLGPAYLPFLLLQFSEAISATTITTQTLQVADATGRALAISVSYDGTVNEAVIWLREPLQSRNHYTVTATTGITDLNGNPLAAPYLWSFRTRPEHLRLYLPVIVR
jgi:hypothetical protein